MGTFVLPPLEVFPVLDGLAYNSSKRPEFKSSVFEALSGKESRVSFRQYPKYSFALSFEFLDDNDGDDCQVSQQLQTLMGFVLRHAGSSKDFWYTDPNDNTVSNQKIATCDGTTDIFQLTRTYGGFTEPVNSLNGAPRLFIDGVLLALGTYTIDGNGVVFLSVAPAAGKVLSWSGSYYYKVRFLDDGYDFTQLMHGFHECADIKMIGSVVGTRSL
ncbi:DUF2460 domain-containing protein [Crenothrix polyspora]|uniref:DUF2460 domain-containing protein n=1 Tax=Crenothrix polyspora TaxID=360316 RepID=A0A1R4HIG4_9GAMM|nr:DUF2460 domain-containing protein [Crenothrix polyspora]SJM96013.1 conserved hypothetical protein [Crenothrix polyspora]